MNIKVGDIWLGGRREPQHAGVCWTFQMIAEGLDDNGNRGILGVKHIPFKRKFMVGTGSCAWFDENGRQYENLGFYLYTRSKAKPIPLLIEKEL
jgi:hypothetical protein